MSLTAQIDRLDGSKELTTEITFKELETVYPFCKYLELVCPSNIS